MVGSEAGVEKWLVDIALSLLTLQLLRVCVD